MRDVAKKIGLGDSIEIKVARLDKSDKKGPQCYAINTDAQLLLEIPSIRTGQHLFQCKYWKVGTCCVMLCLLHCCAILQYVISLFLSVPFCYEYHHTVNVKAKLATA